jgi:mRNA interferase MazF
VARANRGDVWLCDLGMVAKIRPCLVLSVAPDTNDRALVALVPHTTSVRGTRFEVSIPKPLLKSGAFDTQGLFTIGPTKLVRKLGGLESSDLLLVEQRVKDWLGL